MNIIAKAEGSGLFESPGCAEITFETAGGPPSPVFDEIHEQYPILCITNDWWEYGFAGGYDKWESKAEPLPRKSKDSCFVYILKCGDGSLYTGIASDIEGRLAAHNMGKGAKYTRSHLPVTLVWAKLLPTRKEAAREERRIKKLDRAAKLRLVKEVA